MIREDEATTTEAVVQISHVSFRYETTLDAVPILDDVSLTISSDDFLGLIGPNGGGKTTLLRLMLGLLRPQSGRVTVLGRDPIEVSQQIGYVPQQARIDGELPATVLDVVLTGRLGRSGWGCFYRRGHVDVAREAMDKVGVADLEKRGIGSLSGGQRQRVLIARALAAQSRILLLDEPLSGIDSHMEQGILDLLHDLNRTMPIVLVSHDLGFVSAHVKRVGCLNRRLVVHEPGAISHDIIGELYRNQGPVHRIHHQGDCPIDQGQSPPSEEKR